MDRGGRSVKPTIYIRRIPRLKNEWTCTDSLLYTLMACTGLVLPSPYLDLYLIFPVRVQLIEFQEQSVKYPLLHRHFFSDHGLGFSTDLY